MWPFPAYTCHPRHWHTFSNWCTIFISYHSKNVIKTHLRGSFIGHSPKMHYSALKGTTVVSTPQFFTPDGSNCWSIMELSPVVALLNQEKKSLQRSCDFPFNFWHLLFDIRLSTFDIWHLTFDIGHWTFVIGRLTLELHDMILLINIGTNLANFHWWIPKQSENV